MLPCPCMPRPNWAMLCVPCCTGVWCENKAAYVHFTICVQHSGCYTTTPYQSVYLTAKFDGGQFKESDNTLHLPSGCPDKTF